VPKAIQLTGQRLLGIPIIAQLTEAEKNRQARVNSAEPNNANQVPFHRLYVGNIHFSITEADLTNVFEPFGELEFVQLQKEEGGRSRGYGFVQCVRYNFPVLFFMLILLFQVPRSEQCS
jgi:RNA-binding protein 39